jgi:hypothetical protein
MANPEDNNIQQDSPDSDSDKLTTWANEPTLAQLKKNLEDTDANDTGHAAKVELWLNNLHIEGSAKINTKKGRSSIQPKVIRKQAEWRYASLSEPFLNSPDIFNIDPITAGDKNRAIQNELVLNNQFNTKINKVKFIDDFVRCNVDVGSAVIKVGWLTEEEEIINVEPVIQFIPEPTGQLAERYAWLINLRQQDPEAYYDYDRPGLEQALQMFMQTGQAYIPHDTGEVREVPEITETKNEPTVELVDSRNILVDPTCQGDYTKAEFIAEKFKSSISDLKKTGNYVNLDKVNVDAADPISSPDYTEESPTVPPNSFNFEDAPRKKLVVHEYWGMWDIDGNGLTKPIVAAWVGDVLVRMQENPFPDREPPFIITNYMPVYQSVFGEPDGALLEDNQKVIGAVTRGMIDIMGRGANAQTGMRKDMLDVINKRKFNRGEDYEYNAGVDPRQGVFQHVFSEIPQSGYNMLAMQNNEAESISGVKAFNTGISGDSLGESVQNGRSALDAASKREIGILRRLADGITAVGRKIVAMNADFLSEEEVIRVTADEFVTVRRDDLAGNFDLRIVISTAEEDNRKAQELAFMLQTSAPSDDPGEKRIIRAEIARLRKMPALAKKIEEYQPQPDPMAIAKAEKELMLLDAQIAKEQALAAKHGAEAAAAGARGYKDEAQGDLNYAKAGEAGAKARNYDSDSDRKDLDFLEQESGVHQERELEKMGTEAALKKATESSKAQSA